MQVSERKARDKRMRTAVRIRIGSIVGGEKGIAWRAAETASHLKPQLSSLIVVGAF